MARKFQDGGTVWPGFAGGGPVTDPTDAEKAALQQAGQYAGGSTVLTPESAPTVGLDPEKAFTPSQPSVAPYTPGGFKEDKPADQGGAKETYTPPGFKEDKSSAAGGTEKPRYIPPGFKESKPQEQPPAPKTPTEQPPATVAPLPQGPVSLEQEDPQTRISNLIAAGKSPGEAQAIVAGQEPKTISGAPPKTKVEPAPTEEAKAQPEPQVPQAEAPAPAPSVSTKPETTFIQAKSFTPGKNRPIQGIILHSTDGEGQGDINTLTQTGVSVHYYVTRTGQIYQFVNDGDIANHAGKTSGRYVGYNNSNTIGIEQEHYDPGGKGGKNGQDWPDAQVQATAKLVAYLQKKYGLTNDNVLGHSDIAPERKQDPYNYPWDKFRQFVQQGGGAAPGEKGGATSLSQENAAVVSQLNKGGLNTTHYGYPDDPYLDPDSKGGHGKYVAQMKPGYDVALNAAGAAKVGNPKPGSVFKFGGREWRYGDKVPERYSDARFDIYDPNNEFAGIGGRGGVGGKVASAAGGGRKEGQDILVPMVPSETRASAPAQVQVPESTGGGGGGRGGTTTEVPETGAAGYFGFPFIPYPSQAQAQPQQPRPVTPPTEEQNPLVAALIARGFTQSEALAFALSSQALISPGKGVGPLQTQPPPAPAQLLTSGPTGKALALPPPAPSAGAKPSPEVTLPSKQPQIPAGKVPPTTAAAPADKQAVVQALMGMGIKKAHAQQLVANVQGRNVDELLRNALRAHGQGAVRGVEGGSFRTAPPTAPPAPTPKPQAQPITAPPPTPPPEPGPRPAKEPTPYTFPTGGPPPSLAKLTPGLKLSDAVKEHASLLSPDDPRVKKQADGMIKGEHFVPGDPIHDQLLAGLPEGHGGRQRQILGEAEQAIAEKRPMHISYLSAPKEAERYPTRESRMVQYDEHSPEARLMGTTVGQLVGHSFIPTSVGIRLPSKAGEPHQSYIQGISTNILANNFQHLNEKLASMGVGTPYKSLGNKFFNDLEGYFSNLNAGHTGTGRGYAIGTEHHPNEPDASHVPYKLTHKETDFINTVINNTAAFAKHEDAQKLRELARANGTLITEEGETNRMRHNIEQHEPGWRQRVLEPSIRTFKTGLIVGHHPNEQHMPQTIRPGKEFQDLTRAIQRTSARGRPDVPISVSLHHSFHDNRLINKIERDFSENRIDEAEARRQLEAMGEDPNEYRFSGGSGGLVTPYEEDPESITPEEHTQMRDNLRKQWIGGKLNIDDYRRKAAEVPLPTKPSQAVKPAPTEEPPEQVPKPPKPLTPEPEESEEAKLKAPEAPAKLPPKVSAEPPVEPQEKPKPSARPAAPGEPSEQQAVAPKPPAPGEVLPPAKKAAKSPEQIAAEKEDLRQADLHRKKVTPEQQALRDEVQRKALAALEKNPESDPLSAHHYINGHAQFPDWVEKKEHIGKHFDQVNPKLDYAKEEHRQRAADALTHDILHGLSQNSAASDWYDDTVDKSLNHIGQIAPKILTDKDHEMAFKLATAITSQGQDVFPNFESGYHAYRHWHQTGKMPENASIFGGGPKAQAMIANFKKINRLWKELGTDGLREVLEKKMTMRELRDNYGLELAGESPDHVMEGAAMLGPKIGSFYNNLNKRFHSTTFDLWATRNLNRIAGKMLKFSPTSLLKDTVGKTGPRPGQLSRLDALLASGMIEGADKKQQKVMRAEAKALRKLKNPTREAVLEAAPTIAEWAGREHNRYAQGTGGRSYPPALKSESTSLAKNMDLNLTDLADAPRGPKQRQQFRDIYQRAQANLAKHGIDMAHANNQAVLWYIEQKLFQLGGSRNRASFDYLDAAHRLVRKVKSGELPGLQEQPASSEQEPMRQAA